MLNQLKTVVIAVCKLQLISMMISVGATCYAKEPSPCLEGEHEQLNITASLVKDFESHSVYNLLDVLGPHTYSCILVRFKIDDEGKAEDVEIVRSFPRPIFERSVIRSLRASTFHVPDEGKPREGLMLHEVDLGRSEVESYRSIWNSGEAGEIER